MIQKLIRWIGRLFIVTFLLSSTFVKLMEPTTMVQPFMAQYQQATKLLGDTAQMLPSIEEIQPHAQKIVRVIGASEMLIALLVIFGDATSGPLFLFYVLLFGVINYSEQFLRLSAANAASQSEQIYSWIGLVGVGVFMCNLSFKKLNA